MGRSHVVSIVVLAALAVLSITAAGVVLGADQAHDLPQLESFNPQADSTFTVNSTLDDGDGDLFDGVCDTGHVHTLQDDDHVHAHTDTLVDTYSNARVHAHADALDDLS